MAMVFGFDPTIEFFKTSDIMLAALLNIHYGITRLEKDANNRYPNARYYFVFKNSGELYQTLGEWNTYKVLVEPRRYYSSLKQLKSLGELYNSSKTE